MTAQGTSTNPTNIMEQTPWPGNHEYKPWPGYTQAKLLWTYQTNIDNGKPQADSNLGHPKNYAKGYQDKHTGKPFTMANPKNIRDQHPDEEL